MWQDERLRKPYGVKTSRSLQKILIAFHENTTADSEMNDYAPKFSGMTKLVPKYTKLGKGRTCHIHAKIIGLFNESKFRLTDMQTF